MDAIIGWFREIARKFIFWVMTPKIKIFIVPGGRRPVRKTGGSIGYDAFVRAIVSRHEEDPLRPYQRRNVFDFKNTPHGVVHSLGYVTDKWVYRLEPGQKVFVALGAVIEMPFPVFYKVEPRSGLEIKLDITLANHAPIDSDYRGEACALVHNISDEPFDIEYDMRIAQIIYYYGLVPREETAFRHEELSVTDRGSTGYGSTGL